MDPDLANRLRRGLRAGLSTAFGALLCLAALAPPARASDSLTFTITPRSGFPPAIVQDLTAAPGAEGQMLLSWTAPDANNDAYANKSPASGYQLRIATCSVAEAGGSTTTWWNNAQDVGALAAPAVSASPPAPASPGTTQYLLLNQLWPGATYYALIVSSNSAGLVSGADLRSLGVQANALVVDAPPPAPLGLSVAAASRSSFDVSWSSVTAFDLDYYKVSFDSTPPYDFSHFSTSVVFGTTATISGLSGGTYAFKVTAVDRGGSRYPGAALESVAASTVTARLSLFKLPQAPYGVALSTGATLSWLPVVRYEDLTAFDVSSAPASDELTGYSVFRATSPVPSVWDDVADVPISTLTWTDPDLSLAYYYHVRARNATGLSDMSAIRTPAARTTYLVAPDGASFYQVSGPDAALIEGDSASSDSAYLVSVSSRPEELGTLGGRVLKSLQFDAYRGGALLSSAFALSTPGVLSLHYDVAADSSVVPSGLSARGIAPEHMSVYWFNGVKWVQLYGRLDAVSRTMTISTKFFGRYQLRSAERTGEFAFGMAGVSNRFITPNGDGKNDNVVFTFDNPRGSAVSAKIFDLGGRVVAGALPSGPVGDSLTWDGTSAGRSVPAGVYIYQISAEGRSYGGSLVIIK